MLSHEGLSTVFVAGLMYTAFAIRRFPDWNVYAWQFVPRVRGSRTSVRYCPKWTVSIIGPGFMAYGFSTAGGGLLGKVLCFSSDACDEPKCCRSYWFRSDSRIFPDALTRLQS